MPIFLGLIGANGSGKSTVCEYLHHQGFEVISLSDVVRSEAEKKGLPKDRDTLTQLANTLKSQQGIDVLAHLTFKHALQLGTPKIVFDSIRHPAEAAFLRHQGVFVIGIEAPLEVRYQRILSRQKETDHVDFNTFKLQCEREYEGHSSGQNIREALSQANALIINNSDILSLNQKVDEILKQAVK